MTSKQFIEDLLKVAKVEINGNQPWDIQVHNEDFYPKVVRRGTLGLGEAYMDKWWDCDRIDILICKLLRAKLDTHIKTNLSLALTNRLATIFNFQSLYRSKKVAKQHYDLKDELFNVMLDKNKIYSCGYFKKAKTLDEAQIAKLDLCCKKLKLKPGMRVLDIGCGWGGFAEYASKNFDVEVVGVTISEEQYRWAKNHCKNLNVDIRLQDYRELEGSFDRVISIGMFEHVGPLNYDIYMRKINSLLIDEGLFLLHTIGGNAATALSDPWIRQYIFPNSVIPSASEIALAAETFFIMEDWQNFGVYYDKTLMCWYENFMNHWDTLKTQFDERFYRMWVYYLLSCAGAFRARSLQLWQIVYSKGGIANGYMAPR
jgi:cyclopropane-fatty-acyl-phospholipid synthase